MARSELNRLTTLALLVIASAVSSFPYDNNNENQGRCEPITIPQCQKLGYNMTSMPNLIGHENQKAASVDLLEYLPLINSGCSEHLNFFLCSMFSPMCTTQVEEVLVVPVCRPMCLAVKARCEPILLEFTFKWPKVLDCAKLPEKGVSGQLCMQPEHALTAPKLTREQSREKIRESIKTKFDMTLFKSHGNGTPKPPKNSKPGKDNEGGKDSDIRNIPRIDTKRYYLCPDRFIGINNKNSSVDCVPSCSEPVYFRKEDKNFAGIWMIGWAAVSFVSTVVTVLTFLIDTTRFKYPERPIIFLAFCYAVQSIAYIIRSVKGHNGIACSWTKSEEHPQHFLIHEGLESTWCIVVFLLLYYFGMASSLWWVVLTVAWFLASARKWGVEAIDAIGSYFHFAAWAIPAILTIVIMTMRRVDGEELTGMCYVGNQDSAALTWFVLAPLISFLIIGSLFILSGFVALFRIRRNLKHDGTNIRKLEKLMAKIGVFSVLYTVPATCVIGCLFYERVNSRDWRQTAWENHCRKTDRGDKDCRLSHSIPTVEVYMLKIFMSLVVGITSGMWIWTRKTILTWKNFLWKHFLSRCYIKRKTTSKPMALKNVIVQSKRANSKNGSATVL